MAQPRAARLQVPLLQCNAIKERLLGFKGLFEYRVMFGIAEAPPGRFDGM
jgi:hypothetical protein